MGSESEYYFVGAVHFVLAWYDPSRLTGRKTSSVHLPYRFLTHFQSVPLLKNNVFLFRLRGSQSLRGGLKKLRNDLNLPLEGDLRIVMATAEKLKPGLCHILLGERRYDTEYLPNVPDLFWSCDVLLGCDGQLCCCCCPSINTSHFWITLSFLYLGAIVDGVCCVQGNNSTQCLPLGRNFLPSGHNVASYVSSDFSGAALKRHIC